MMNSFFYFTFGSVVLFKNGIVNYKQYYCRMYISIDPIHKFVYQLANAIFWTIKTFTSLVLWEIIAKIDLEIWCWIRSVLSSPYPRPHLGPDTKYCHNFRIWLHTSDDAMHLGILKCPGPGFFLRNGIPEHYKRTPTRWPIGNATGHGAGRSRFESRSR